MGAFLILSAFAGASSWVSYATIRSPTPRLLPSRPSRRPPTLYSNGQVVDPAGAVTVYYGSRLKDPSRTQPFPAGFRMIAGNAKQQVDTPDHQGNHFWCAGIGGSIGRTPDGVFPICA